MFNLCIEKNVLKLESGFSKVSYYICLHKMLHNCQNVFSEKYLVPFFL